MYAYKHLKMYYLLNKFTKSLKFGVSFSINNLL